MKKSIKIIVLAIILILIALFLIRLINPKEIDDISPQIPCTELEEYSSDVLYIIPYYNNVPISENKAWCNYIASLNKTLQIHGISHNYREFLYSDISQEELYLAINEFEKCFGYKPEVFKAPQLKINSQNKRLIKSNNLILKNDFSQITHKVYHCNDSGRINNKIINLI